MKNVSSDVLFLGNRGGLPAIVSKTDKQADSYTLETDAAKLKKFHRHGFINGLSAEDKVTFNQILDDFKEDTDEPRVKIEGLKDKIEDLQTSEQNKKLAEYLQGELFHMMRKHDIHPKTYQIKAGRDG